MPTSRDYRADLFRGIALLTIFANHFNVSALNTEWAIFKLTPSNFTYFSGAETFVFISGYVFGVVYKKWYVTRGWWSCYQKALWRAWDLYRANVITFSVVLAFCAAALSTGALADVAFFPALANVFRAPQDTLPAILGMTQTVRYFEILNLYVLLLLFVPVFLAVAHRAPMALLALSVLAYGLVLNGSLTGIGAGFNVWQWQCHFVFGLLAGWYQPVLARRALLVGAAAGFLLVGAVDVYALPRLTSLGWVAADSFLNAPLPLEGKGGLLALLQFLGAVYLVHCYLPRGGVLYKRWFVRPIVVTGQYSLPVFCVGIVLTYVAVLLTRTAVTSPLLTLGLLGLGLALSVGTGYLMAAKRRLTRLASPVRPLPKRQLDGDSLPVSGAVSPFRPATSPVPTSADVA